ncbi:DUF983 domain-containing protein [Endobacterium cereale]|uniref:DUF983 domain-containing protein n=1 Tax=Endobacterium cereale TaxID=2663029 RepID=UPI003977E8E9
MRRKPSFNAPTDRLTPFVVGFICLIGVALASWIQIAYSPSIWMHVFIALPCALLAYLLQLLNRWLPSGLGSAESQPGLGTTKAAQEPRVRSTRV